MSDKIREAFESFYAEKAGSNIDALRAARWGDNGYRDPFAASAWFGWQAGLAQQSTPAAPVAQEPVAGVVLRDGQPTLVMEKFIKLTDQRLYAAPPAAEQPKDKERDHQIRLLAKALGDCIVAAGITRPDAELSGPELLMFADDLKRSLAEQSGASAQLASIEAMCAMVEAREWADHVGVGEIGKRVEHAISTLRNDPQEAQRTAMAEQPDTVAVPRELLGGLRELSEYWFTREDTRGISESDFKTWHALGFGSKAFTELLALLAKEGE